MHYLTLLTTLLLFAQCNGQTAGPPPAAEKTSRPVKRTIPGNCETCETMFVGMPQSVDAVDTCIAWKEQGEHVLIEGTVYRPDGRTPAADVVLYYWHTNARGLYPGNTHTDGSPIVHGRFRGWVKTGADGTYRVYTTRPAPYPDGNIPAHVHFLVLEPDAANPYWISDLLFAGDPLISETDRRNDALGRGGPGITRTEKRNSLWLARKDIVLGKNVENYPE